MKKKSFKVLLWHFLADLIFISVVIYALHFSIFLKKENKINSNIKKERIVVAKKCDTNKLTDYIMKYSSRISRNTANLIAKEILKTKHPLLITALIQRESNFRPFLVSKKNAIGLGQINITVKENIKLLKDKGIIKELRDLYDPVIGVRACEVIFEYHLKKNNYSLVNALKSYVGSKYFNSYVNDILKNYGELSLVCSN